MKLRVNQPLFVSDRLSVVTKNIDVYIIVKLEDDYVYIVAADELHYCDDTQYMDRIHMSCINKTFFTSKRAATKRYNELKRIMQKENFELKQKVIK